MSNSTYQSKQAIITPLLLYKKSPHIILCNRCSYFPTHHQLPQNIISQSIFQLKWLCPYCKSINFCSTDCNYKYYCFNHVYRFDWNEIDRQGQYIAGMIIDQANHQKKQMNIYIDVGFDMKDVWTWLGAPVPAGKKLGFFGKQQLTQQSALLKAYLESEAIRLRSEKGQYFSWHDFLKQQKLSKIQYALWLTDKIKQQKKQNIEVSFFVHSKQYEQSNQVILKSIIYDNFLRKLQKIRANFVARVKMGLITNQDNQEGVLKHYVVISSSPLKEIIEESLRFPKGSKVLIIALQDMQDPIHLSPTSTALYHYFTLQANIHTELEKSVQTQSQILKTSKPQNSFTEYAFIQNLVKKVKQQDIQIFDSRLLEPKSIKQDKQFIEQILQQEHHELFVFLSRCKNGNGKKNIWQKIVDKNMYRYLKQKRQKQRNKTFTSKKDANQSTIVRDVLEMYQTLVRKQGLITVEDINKFLQATAGYFKKGFEIKIILKFVTKHPIELFLQNSSVTKQKQIHNDQQSYKYTVLWCQSSTEATLASDLMRMLMGSSDYQIFSEQQFEKPSQIEDKQGRQLTQELKNKRIQLDQFQDEDYEGI